MRAEPAQDVGYLVIVKKVDHRMRREQAGAEQGQVRVLTVEAICVSVECEVVEVEEPVEKVRSLEGVWNFQNFKSSEFHSSNLL